MSKIMGKGQSRPHPKPNFAISAPKESSDVMIQRAISSAKKHNIDVQHGRKNEASGNCAIESVLYNIEDRPCFDDRIPFSVDYYRRIWMTDFKNRTIDDPTWNIYSKQQWEEGWNELMQSGVYERGLFGDLMMFAIACGVRKVLLIFNTNLNTPHDPIYVCDPRKFDVQPDTDVPVVLAYDMAHYESLHPVTPSDRDKTSVLVNQYLEGNYRFGRNDIPYLLQTDNMQIETATKESEEERPVGAQIFENSLPEHLRGKRPKDMDPKEKKGI